MLRKRHGLYLALLTALAAAVAALPASAHAHHGQIPCMGNPDYVGHMGDTEGWFRYPVGRGAEHINAGTFTLAIDDTSTTQNFRLRDLTWQGTHVNEATSLEGQSEECWTVTLDVGDYEWVSDGDQNGYLRGLVTAHPNPNPPPPPPPPGGGPPPPPPPPAQPDLILTVGPDPRIAAFYADGRPVTNLPPGTYTIQVHDLSAAHNFHLTGPGVDEKTSVGDIEHPVWRLTLRAGKYTFKCDVHSTTIKGSFTVSTNAPPLPKCKVPRVIGKGLSKGKRAIRAAHCSVGRVRYMRSKRPKGRIVRQSPGAGRTLAVGSKVGLVVSRGPG